MRLGDSYPITDIEQVALVDDEKLNERFLMFHHWWF